MLRYTIIGLWLFFFAATGASAQNLTISSAGETGSSGTNWSISGNTLTVTGTANIASSVVTGQLASNSLSIQGNSTSFAVYVNQSITSSASGNGLTIGAASNTGNISLNSAVSLAGAVTIIGGRVSISDAFSITGSNNLSITSINTVIIATATVGGLATINASGNFILGTNVTAGTGFPLTATGGFTKTGAGTSYLFSNINTTNTAVTVAGPVVVGNFNTSSAITQINTNGGNISIPGAVSAYSGAGRDYLVLVYANLYDADASTVTGSSTDIYLRFNAGNHFYYNVPGMPATYNMQYLVVAGGGGGGAGSNGAFTGGGGGGGGVADGTYSFTGSSLTVSVGTGGGLSSTGNDSYLETIKSGGGGGGGNYNTTLGLVGTGGSGYTAGGGGGGAGSNMGTGRAGGTGTQRTGGTGAASGSFLNFGGSGGGAVGNGSGYLSGGSGYSSSITGAAVVYGAGAAVQGTPVAKTGGGGGSQFYGTFTGADGVVILSFSIPTSAASLSTSFLLNAAAGSVTLGSTVANLSAVEITAGAASSITGPVTGTGTLLKTGTGALTLSGDNRYSGGTTVTAGTLVLDDTSPNDGQSVIVGTLNINQNGTVQLKGNPGALGYSTNRVTTININGGILETSSGQQHIWNLTGGLNFNGGGTLRSNGGTSAAAATSYFEWGATNITITNPTSPAEIAGRINLRSEPGDITFTVADGTTDNDLLISAAITQSSAPALTKTGAGKLTFTGTNSYTGATTISAGTLQIGSGGTVGTISSAAVTNNAALIFNRSNDFTISNVISGTGTVTKTGAGILTLSGANTYTGLTTISQGILKCGSTSPLGTVAGGTTIADGAALDLNGNTLASAEPLTINGTGVSASGAIYNSTVTAVTLPGPITLASNATIQGTSGDLTLSGTINGAFALNIGSTNKAYTQSGILGGTTSPTAYTVNVGATGQATFSGATTVLGPVSITGGTLAVNANLTATSNTVTLTAGTTVSQTAPITANGLSLNGTGTFTLTNTSNNFTTLAGGAVGILLGATQVIDVSGGLTIGTVGANTGLTGSSTIRVETLAGDLTLAGSISTTSTSIDAVILTAAKSTAIGVPTGGDILVLGSPTITMGSGAIAKLFSGYDVTSTGLTTLVGGASNVRNNYDETTTTFNPVLSANNKYAIYRTALGYGDLNIVSSGADAEGTTWTYANGVITTTSGTANVLNTVVQTKLNATNLSIEANKVTFSANVTGTTSNTFSILSKTHIVNTNATTITTQGGNVLFASNVDNATDGESTTNGTIQLMQGITITTNGGNITFGGGDASGSDYSFGSSDMSTNCGIQLETIIALNSGGGNITLRGKSYAMGVNLYWAASGVGFYNFSGATGTINSGTGTITIDGFSQTHTSSYSSGIYSMHNMTITSANTTDNAIRLIGKATGTSAEAWGMETENIFSVLATGTGGGITVSSSQQNSANNYDIVFRGETNILAKSGPINLLGGQSGGIANGIMFFSSNLFLGSKASSAVPTSSSNITIQYDLYVFNAITAKLATSGTLNWKPVSASFGQNVYTSWFDWNQNSQTMSGLTIGKSGNAANVYLNNAITVAGPISVYGNYVEFSGNMTSSANGDIFIKSIINGYNPSVYIGSVTINKSAGTGTLTFQASGRVQNYGTLSATGTGKLNVVMWSDYDNTNNDGGVSQFGTISTNGGHVWMGGSNATSGSYTWNGLTVGDGPSIGSTNYNCNAIDLFGPITTSGGDVLLWASSPASNCGSNGIVSDGIRVINAGAGNITLIAPQTSGSIELTSTGVVSLLPNAGSYAGALTLGGTLTSGNFTFNTSYYNGLKINSLANAGLVIGNYSGHLSGSTAVTQGNTSTVTASSGLTTKSLEIYGGSVVASAALIAAGNIILDGDNGSFLSQNTKGVEINAAVTTTNNGNITINGRGGSATAVNTFGINVTNLVEAGGTGNIELVGYGGLSFDNLSGSSSHGVNIEGASAWVKSNGGNVAITGYGGGAGVGTYSQGVPILTSAKVSAAGSGTISITGTGGVNTAIGLRGVVITSGSSIYSAGGAISITGNNGTNGSDNSDGVTVDNSTIGSNTSGPITITGSAGGGTGSEAISFSNTNTLGGASHANNVVLRGNNFSITGTNSLLTTGQVTVEPNSNSFSSALTFPISTLSLASTISGLTIGKSTNTANITVASATSVAGPITIIGGAIALNANLTTTNTSTGNIALNGTTIAGTGNAALAAGRTATINISSTSTYDGLISGTGSGFTKMGTGLLTLTKDHNYSGPTVVSAGDLQVGTGGSVSQTSSGTVSNTSGVTVASNSKFILTPNENVLFAAPIAGAGGVEIKGASGAYYNAAFLSATWVDIATSGTVLEILTRITGAQQCGTTYASSATLAAGAYRKSYDAATNTATLQFQQYDGTNTLVVFARLQQSGAKVQISVNTTPYGTGAAFKAGNNLDTDLSTGGTSRTLATSCTVNQIGIKEVYMSGKVNFTGALTYTGTTTLSNTVTNSTYTVAGTNTYSYTSRGTQEITDASSSFPSTSTVVNNGLVIFNRSTALTISSDMSGTEEVLQVGAAITLTGSNTYTGNTTIDLNKSLNIGSGAASGSMAGNIVNYGALTFNRSGSSSYAGVISATGSLTKSGNGALTMTGLNTYTGATTVSAGSLILERNVPATSSSGFSGAGTLVIQPSSASFTNPISYPISGFTVSSAIGGLTVGKLGSTANITVTSATQAAGPITFYGDIMALNANVSATSNGNINLYANTLTFGSSITVASGGELLIAPSSIGNTIGVAGSTGNLAIPNSYFTTNFADGFSNITIGSDDQTGNIVISQVTIRDNMSFKTTGSLVLENSSFDIGAYQLTLGPSMTVTGMPTYYIKTSSTGVVKRNVTTGSSLLFPIGKSSYNPVTITNNTGTADDFTVLMLDFVYASVSSGATISSPRVNRTWNIGKTNANIGAGVDFTFQWDTSEELGSFAGTGRKLNHHNGTTWSFAAGTSGTPSVSGSTKTMTHTSYTGTFSPFAISDATTVLPVTWQSFEAKKLNDRVILSWSTASEQNTKDFEILHSTDANNWNTIGNVLAAGNSNTSRSYSFDHMTPVKHNSYNFYRIKQYDLDGKYSFSKIISIIYNVVGTDFMAYPNPATNKLTVYVSNEQEVQLIKLGGTTVWKDKLTAGPHVIRIEHLARGMYLLKAGSTYRKIILQ